MAATADLDTITTHAREAGAKVLLVGDWAQLSPVGAGGAFRLLATDRDDTATLHDVRRFRHEWERTASAQLRAGDPTAIDTYISRGRVEGGDRESMLDLLHARLGHRRPRRTDLDHGRVRRADRHRPQRPRPRHPRPRRRGEPRQGCRWRRGRPPGWGTWSSPAATTAA